MEATQFLAGTRIPLDKTEGWRVVWHEGFAPLVTTCALKNLAAALEKDDPRLIQGATTTPPPLMYVLDWPVEAGCAVAFVNWQSDDPLVSVGQVEECFARMCYHADQRLGAPAACRMFLNWFDDTDRDEMRRLLLPEVIKAIKEREDGTSPYVGFP